MTETQDARLSDAPSTEHVAPVEAPQAAPEPQAPSPAPETAAPAPETPKTDSPAVEAPSKPEEASALQHKPSLLGEAMKKDSAPEKKPSDAPPAESKESAPEEKKDAPATAPAVLEYEAFKLPEGVTWDESQAKEIKDLFGEGKLTQEYGQKLLDRAYKEVQEVAKRIHQNGWNEWNALQEKWKSQSINDPEFGGNRYETSLREAVSVLDEHATPALRDALSTTGIGNNPEFFRFLLSVHAMTGESSRPLTPSNPPHKPKSKAEILYG